MTSAQNFDLNMESSDLLSDKKHRVSPWKNKEEFEMVYNCLYGPSANQETKMKAFRKMMVWKLRRLDLTPAAILSTLVVIELQLKDNSIEIKSEDQNNLKILYSSALTRFLNYMSSIAQKKWNMKSMYDTAKQLGLESFVVDLRHLCAHGQTMPSLETLRKTLDYCGKWLKEFYWDDQLKSNQNAEADRVKQKVKTAFYENINRLFLIYDAATNCAFKGCQLVSEGKKILSQESYVELKKFSNEKDEKSLEHILSLTIKELSTLVKREPGLKDVQQTFVSAFMNMTYFFLTASHNPKTPDDVAFLILLHKQLFHALAFFGFIEEIFHSLIQVCENNEENVARRRGSSFWAHQILKGCVAFKTFKQKCKEEKEKNPLLSFDLSTLNNPTAAKDIRNFYEKIGVNIKSTLLFADTFRRPWSLQFTKEYINQRVKNVNEFTVEMLESCMLLLVPSFTESQIEDLKKLISIYFNGAQEENNAEETTSETENAEAPFEYYSLHKNILRQSSQCPEPMNVDSNQEDIKFGIWSTVSDGHSWNICPLGRLPWE